MGAGADDRSTVASTARARDRLSAWTAAVAVPDPAGRRTAAAIALAAAVAAVLVGWRFRPSTLFDDAAITFRYADRLARGLGFTYNTGDVTDGASAPLYTLLLAGAARIGVAPPDTAAFGGVLLLGTSAALIAWLGARVAGPVAAVVAPGWLVASEEFRNVVLSGMESGLAVVLGLCALLALSARRPVVAGAIAGLAVVNRLDAILLAGTVVAATAVVDRRALARTVGVMAAVALPWLAFSTLAFGSPVPFSATQKLMSRSGSWDQDPTWVLRVLLGRHGTPALLLALAAPVVCALLVRRRQRVRAATLGAALAWSAGHAVLYSAMDLGAPYPWYTTVAFVGVALGAAATTATAAASARKADGPAWIRVAAVLGVLALVVGAAPGWAVTVRGVVDPPPERTSRLLDGTRRDAGRYVDRRASPGEVVRTCFGWVAYEARDLDVDEVCPLNTRRPVAAPTWWVESPGPDEPRSAAPPGAVRVATFERDGPDGTVVRSTVYRRWRRARRTTGP